MKILLLLYAFCVHLVISQQSIDQYKDAFRQDSNIGNRLVEVCLNPSKALSYNCRQSSVSTDAVTEEFLVMTCFVNPNVYYRDCGKALDLIMEDYSDRDIFLSKTYSDTCDASEGTCDMLWDKIRGEEPALMVPIYDTRCLPSQEDRKKKKCENILNFAEQEGDSNVELKDFFEKVKNQNEMDKFGDELDVTNIGKTAIMYRANCGGILTEDRQIFCGKLEETILKNTVTSENINKILEAVCVETVVCTNLKEVILGSTRADDVFLFSCNMENTPETYNTDEERQKACEKFFTHCATSTAKGCETVKKHQNMAEALRALDKPAVLKEKLEELCKGETAETIAAQEEKEDKTPCREILDMIAKNEDQSKNLFVKTCNEAPPAGTFDLCSVLHGIYGDKDTYKTLFEEMCKSESERKTYICQTFSTFCKSSTYDVCKPIKKQFAVDNMKETVFTPFDSNKIAELYKELCDGSSENFCVQLNDLLKTETTSDFSRYADVVRKVCITPETVACERIVKETLGDSKGYDRFVNVCDVTAKYTYAECKVFFDYCVIKRTAAEKSICDEEIAQDYEHLINMEKLDVKDLKATPAVVRDICETQAEKFPKNCERAIEHITLDKAFLLQVYQRTCDKYEQWLCEKLWKNMVKLDKNQNLIDVVYTTMCREKKDRTSDKCQVLIKWCWTREDTVPQCPPIVRQQYVDGIGSAFKPFSIDAVAKWYTKLCDGIMPEFCEKISGRLMRHKTNNDISSVALSVCKADQMVRPACDHIVKAILKSEKSEEIYKGACDVEKKTSEFVLDSPEGKKRLTDCEIFFDGCKTAESDQYPGCSRAKKDKIFLDYVKAIKDHDATKTSEQLEKACAENDLTNCDRLYRMIVPDKDWSKNAYVISCDTGKKTCDVQNQFLEKIAVGGFFDLLYTEICSKSVTLRKTQKCLRFDAWCQKEGSGSKHAALCVLILRRFEADQAAEETVSDPSVFGERYTRFCDGFSEDICKESNGKLPGTSLKDLSTVTLTVCRQEFTSTPSCQRILQETLLLNNPYQRFVELCTVTKNFHEGVCKLFFDFCETSANKLTLKGKETCTKEIREDQVHTEHLKKLNVKSGSKEAAKILQKACKDEAAQFTKNCQRALDVVALDKLISVETYKENCDTYPKDGSCKKQWETMTIINPQFHLTQTFGQLCTMKEERNKDKCKNIHEWCSKDVDTKADTNCIYINRQYQVDGMEKSFDPFDQSKVVGLFKTMCDGKTEIFCEELSKRVIEERVTKQQVSGVTTTLCATPSPNAPCDAIMKAVLSNEKRSNEIFLDSCDVDKDPKQYHTTGKQKKYCEMYFTVCKSALYVGCSRVKEDDEYSEYLKNYDESDAPKTAQTLSKACVDDASGTNCGRLVRLVTLENKKEFTYNVFHEVCSDDGNMCRRMFEDIRQIPDLVEFISETGCNNGDDMRTVKCKTINDWCNEKGYTDPRCIYIDRATKVVSLKPKHLADNLEGAKEVSDIGKAVCDGASKKVCTAFLKKVFSDKTPTFLAKFSQMNTLTCDEQLSQACQTYMGEMLKTTNHKERYHAVCDVEGDLPLSNCKVFFDYCGTYPTVPNCAQILVDSKYGEAMKNVDKNAGSDVPLGKAVYTLCKDGMDSQNCKRVLTAVEEKKFVQDAGAVFKSACDDAAFCEKLWNEKISSMKSVKDFNNEACATEDARKKNYCQAILKWCKTSTDADCPAVTASFDMDNMDAFFNPFQPQRIVDIYRKLCVEESERCAEINKKLMEKVDQIKEFLPVVCLQHTEDICQRFVLEIINAEDAIFDDVYNTKCGSVKLKANENQMCYPFFTFCSKEKNVHEPRCSKIKADNAEVARSLALANDPKGTAFFLNTACSNSDKAECDKKISEILNLSDDDFVNVFNEICTYKDLCLVVADKKFKNEMTKSVKMVTSKCVTDRGEPVTAAPRYCKPMQTWCENNGPTHGNAVTKKECENHVNIYRFANLLNILRPKVNVDDFVKYYRGFCDPPNFERMCTETTKEVKILKDSVVSKLVLAVCEGFSAKSEAEFSGLPPSCQKIAKASIEKSDKGFKEVCNVEKGWDGYTQEKCNPFFFACPLTSAAPGACDTILADRELDKVVQKTSKNDGGKTSAAVSSLCAQKDDMSVKNCQRFLDFFVFKTDEFFISQVLSGVCKTNAESCTTMTRTLAASSQKSFSDVYDKLCSVKTERSQPHCQVFKQVCAVPEYKASVQEKCDFISKQFEMDEKLNDYFASPFDNDKQKKLVEFYTKMCDGTTEDFCKTVTGRMMSEKEEPTKKSRLSQSPTIITEVCEATGTTDENKGCAKILEAALTSNDQIADIYKNVCRVQQDGQKQKCKNFYEACARDPNLYGCKQIVNEDMKFLEFIKGINKTDVPESMKTIVRASSDKNNYPRLIAYLMEDLNEPIFVTTLSEKCFTDKKPITVCRRIMEAAHEHFESFAKSVATGPFCSNAQNIEAGFCTTMSSICSTEQLTDRCYEVHKKECKGKAIDKHPVCTKHIRFYCEESKPLEPCTTFILSTMEYESVAQELGEACSKSTVVVPGRCEAFYSMVMNRVGLVLSGCGRGKPTEYCKQVWQTCGKEKHVCVMSTEMERCSVRTESSEDGALECEQHVNGYCTRPPLHAESEACAKFEESVSQETNERLGKVSEVCSKPIVDGLRGYCESVAKHFHVNNKGAEIFRKECNQGVLFGKVTTCKVLRYTCELSTLKTTELCKTVLYAVQVYEAYNALDKTDLSAVVAYLNKFCKEKPDDECVMAEKHLAGDHIDIAIFVRACDENNEPICDRYFTNKVATDSEAVFVQFERLCPMNQLQSMKCIKMRDWCGKSIAPSDQCTKITRNYKVADMEKEYFETFIPANFSKFHAEICVDNLTETLCAQVEKRMLREDMPAVIFSDLVTSACGNTDGCSAMLKAILSSGRSAELFLANCDVDSRVEINCQDFRDYCSDPKKAPHPEGCKKVLEDMEYQDLRNEAMHPTLLNESVSAIQTACENGVQLDGRNCKRLYKLVLEDESYTLSMADLLCAESTDEAVCTQLLKDSLDQYREVINKLATANCKEERKSVICQAIDRLCVTGHASKCYEFHSDKCANPESEKLICFNIFNYYCGNDYLSLPNEESSEEVTTSDEESSDQVTTSAPTMTKVDTHEDLCWKFIQSMTNTEHKKGAFGEKCEADSAPCTKVVELDYTRGSKDLMELLFGKKCTHRIDPIMCDMTMKLCKDAVKTPQCLVIEKPMCAQGSFEQCKPVLDRHCRPLVPDTCSQMIEFAESNVEKTTQVLHYHCNTAHEDKLCQISMEKAKSAGLLADTFNSSCGQPEKRKIGECQRVNTFCNSDSSSQCELVRKMIDGLEIDDSDTCQKADAVCEEKVQKFCIDTTIPACDILFQKMPKDVLFHFYNHCVDGEGSELVCEKSKGMINEKHAVAELFAARCPGLAFITRKCKDIRDMCMDNEDGNCSAVNRNYTIVLASGIAGAIIGALLVLAGILLYLYKIRKAAEALKKTKQREKSMYLDSMME